MLFDKFEGMLDYTARRPAPIVRPVRSAAELRRRSPEATTSVGDRDIDRALGFSGGRRDCAAGVGDYPIKIAAANRGGFTFGRLDAALFIPPRKAVAQSVDIIVEVDDPHFRVAARGLGHLPVPMRRPKVLNNLLTREQVAFNLMSAGWPMFLLSKSKFGLHLCP